MEKAKFIIKVVMAVVGVASLTLGILTYHGIMPTKISPEGIKHRIDDINLRIDIIESEIEQRKAQGEEVAELESELSEAEGLNKEANHEWQVYNFTTAHEKVQDAEQKVFDLERELWAFAIPPPTLPLILVGLGAALLISVIVLIFKTRRV